MHWLRYWSVGVIVAAANVGPAMADVIFQDSTFNLSNYTATAPFLSNATVGIVVSQCASCGNPGSGLQTVTTFTSSPTGTSAAETLINNNFSYNPQTQGAIMSIDASVDKDIFTTLSGTGFGNSFRLTIEQGGVYYIDVIAGPTFNGPNDASSPGYGTISGTDLVAADFLSYDPTTGITGSANPNFDGTTILFGLTQNTGNGGAAGDGTLTTEYDNLDIDVHQAVEAIPEPGSLALLATALSGFGLIRRRGRKRPGSL